MNKKIGIFSYDFFPFYGGIGRYLSDLYKGLYYKKEFIVFSPCKNEYKNHVSLFTFTKKVGKQILFSLLLNFKINSLISKYNLKTIHLQCGPGGILLLFKPKVKLICTVHHTYYQQASMIPEQRWKYFFYFFEKIMYKNANEIICNIEGTKNILISKYGINKDLIKVIYISINTNTFRKLNNIKKELNSLLFVGRLDARKGIMNLVSIIPEIVRDIPDLKIYIVGKGPLRQKIDDFINQNNLIKNFIFMQDVTDKDLCDLYNKVQLTVVPSVFEGFGITPLESIACGTGVLLHESDGLTGIYNACKSELVQIYFDKKDFINKLRITLINRNFKTTNKDIQKILKPFFIS